MVELFDFVIAKSDSMLLRLMPLNQIYSFLGTSVPDGLNLLRMKSFTYTTTNPVSCTVSHVTDSCVTEPTGRMVKILFAFRIIPPPLRFHLSALLSKKPNK